MSKKGFAPLITIIIVAVIIGAGSVAYRSFKVNAPVSTTSTTTAIQIPPTASSQTTVTTENSTTATTIKGVMDSQSRAVYDAKDNNKINFSFSPLADNPQIIYHVSVPIDKIFTNRNGQLEKAKFTDLIYGTSITVMGGNLQKVGCTNCMGKDININNPEKIILDLPVTFESNEYKGKISGERGGGGLYSYIFYPDLDYNLRLLKDKFHTYPYTSIVSDKSIPELERWGEAQPDSIIVKGKIICPKMLSFPCTIWGESVKVLSLQGGQPNEKLNFEGRLGYRYWDTITDGLDTKYYFFIRITGTATQDETIWVTNQTKFYFINTEGIKQQLDSSQFTQIRYNDDPTDPTNPLLQVLVTKVCDSDNLNLIKVCKYLADEVLIKSSFSFN